MTQKRAATTARIVKTIRGQRGRITNLSPRFVQRNGEASLYSHHDLTTRMASWRFQGAKHQPNQNNSGSFPHLQSPLVILQERLQAVVQRGLLALQPAVSQLQVPRPVVLQERMRRLAAVHSG